MIERAQPGPMATILLVDDDPLQASLMTSLLRGRFDEVKRTVDAAEALCLIEQPEFAGKLGLVISAHHTPGSAGRHSWPSCMTACLLCPSWCWARPGEAAGDYADEHVAFLPTPVRQKRY